MMVSVLASKTRKNAAYQKIRKHNFEKANFQVSNTIYREFFQSRAAWWVSGICNIEQCECNETGV